MKSVRLAVLSLAVAAAIPAFSTTRIGEEAVAIGQPAQNCSYCHTFDSDHMRQRAREAGMHMRRLECGTCHGRALRTGVRILNDRGLWMRTRRLRLKTERVDVAWLADYDRAKRPAP